MSSPAEAWGEAGSALWEVPDTELSALATKLRDLAMREPGRSGEVYRAFAGMVDFERRYREEMWKPPGTRRSPRHLSAVKPPPE